MTENYGFMYLQVSGTAGLVTLYFILTGLTKEMNQLQRPERPSSKIEQKLDDLAEREFCTYKY